MEQMTLCLTQADDFMKTVKSVIFVPFDICNTSLKTYACLGV